MDNQILQTAADQYKTPAYVFDLDEFTSRICSVKEILGDRVEVYYAMKANPFLTRTASAAADGLEVCSPGEYAICCRAGIPAAKIVLSGVNKDKGHIMEVIRKQGAHTYTVESPGQLKLLEQCAAAEGMQIRVLLRLTSGNQFGMDQDAILTIIKDRLSYPHLKIDGLQYYSGTQKRGTEKIHSELLCLDSLCRKIRREMCFDIHRLEYGPGFYVPYFQGEHALDQDTLLKDFKKTLDSLEFKGIIVLEAGRFLAASCGSYVTRVVDTKINLGQRYCIVDGGINHLNYYGQAMAMKVPAYRHMPQDEGMAGRGMLHDSGRTESPGKTGVTDSNGNSGSNSASGSPSDERWTVCGSLCTSGDILVKNLPLSGLKPGDLLVFDKTGAYSVTEGIYLFLSRELPCILTYTAGQGLSQVRGLVPTDSVNDGSCACTV